MGITFLAAGTSVPEAVSSVIVAKQGIYIFFLKKLLKFHRVLYLCFITRKQDTEAWELVIH